MPKQLVGTLTFTKPSVKIWEDAHGDKRCKMQIEVITDFNTAVKLSAAPQAVFEADVFLLDNQTFGSKQA